MIWLMVLEVSLCLGNGRVCWLAEIIHSSLHVFINLAASGLGCIQS